MSDSNYLKYTVGAGEGWIIIAEKFYNCTEMEFLYILARENDKYLNDPDLEGYDRLGPINKDEKIKLPLFIQYVSQYDSRKEYEGTDIYVAKIEQTRSRNPVELCYDGFNDDKPLARRFIYCWKRIIPNEISNNHYNTYFKNNMTSQQERLFHTYYSLATDTYRFNRYWYGDYGKQLTGDDKKSFYELFKSVQYPYAWEDHEILMTDDWGQPRRIEEYIQACRDSNLPQLIGSDYYEEVDEENWYTIVRFRDTECPEESRFANHPMEDYYNYLGRFAFYTPKEIEEIHFVEHCSRLPKDPSYNEADEVRITKYLDKREYFSTGEVYAFLFAPLDTIWARDEVVNLHQFPRDIADEDRPSLGSDYLNELRSRLEIPDIIDHPPTFHSNELWNVDKLISEGKAQEITIPLETTGTYSDKAIVIKLKPTFYEYISLLKKYTYNLQKGLKMLTRAKINLQSVGKVAEEMNHFTHLMRFYPNEPEFETNEKKYKVYSDDIDKYRKKIDELIQNIKEIDKSDDIKVESGFSIGTPLIHLCVIEKESYDLIKEDKSCEFTPISERLIKVTGIFDNKDFKDCFSTYIDSIRNKDHEQTSYFSFQHPWLTPFYAVINACITIGFYPDEKDISDFYTHYIVPLEDTLELMYYEDNDKHFHNNLTKSVLEDILNLSDEDGKKIFDESETTDENEITVNSFIRDFIQDDTIIKTVTNPPKESVLTQVARVLEYIPPVWNNFPGVDSQMTRLIKVYTYFRWKGIISNLEKTFDALTYCKRAMREYMLSTCLFRNVYKARRFINKVVPELGAVKAEYVEIIAIAFYKKFWTSRLAKQGVHAAINRIDEVTSIIQGRINRSRSRIRKGLHSIGSAPRWVDRFATGLQIAVSLYGIFRILTKKGEFTGNDILELISYVANGGLALLGLPVRFVLRLLRLFHRFNLINAMRYIRIGSRVLTIIDFAIDLIFASQKYLWAENTGDVFDIGLAMARCAVSIAGAAWWTFVLIRLGGQSLVRGGLIAGGSLAISGVGTLIGIIILLIEVVIFIIEWIVDSMKTGTRKTLENLVNLLNDVARYATTGYPYVHSDFFNIATKWRVIEREIKNYPPVSFHISTGDSSIKKRRIFHTFQIPKIMNFNKSDYHISNLPYQPLNYRYSVPALVFRGWSLDSIINLHKSGWSDEHKDPTGKTESDELVEERIRAIYEYWEEQIEKNNTEIIDYMQDLIKNGEKLSESVLKSKKDNFLRLPNRAGRVLIGFALI